MPDSAKTHLVMVLEAEMERRGWTPYVLARIAGLKEDAVRDIIRGKVLNPGPVKLQALAACLGMTIGQLVGDRDMEISSPHPYRADERDELLKIYEDASPEWRQVLLSMARYVAHQSAGKLAPPPLPTKRKNDKSGA